MNAASDLVLAEPSAVADLTQFVSRASVLVPGGYVRMQAAGQALQFTVLVRSGEGLLGTGTVTGMRGVALAEGAPATCDVLVDLAGVAARLARMTRESSTRLAIPAGVRSAAWAAVTAPRSGWEVVGEADAADLREVAARLLAPVTKARDDGASEAQIAAADKAAWGGTLGEGLGQFRAGLVLGAHALGFLTGSARVLRHGSWQRLTTPAGSVIGR